MQDAAKSPALALRDVSLRAAGGVPILHEVSWRLPAGEVAAVVGPSGAGKSRLLRLCNRLDEPTAGEIEVLGRPIDAWDPRALRRAAAWVPQQPALGRGGARDALRPLVDLGITTERALDQALPSALATVALAPATLTRALAALSGGERLRLGVLRALLAAPRLLLLDEPTSSLDGATAAALIDGLRAWRRDHDATLVVVTHRLADVRALGGRVLALDGGRVAHEGVAAEALAGAAGEMLRGLLAGEGG